MSDEKVSYEMFFGFSIEMLCIANTDGYFEVLNPAWERALGWTVEELTSRPFLDFVHPDDVPSTLAEVVKLSEGHATISFENRYRTRDGGWKWLSWTAGPDPSTGKLYAAARDVTRRREMQLALVEAREASEAANVAKSRFLANMSHELRTPLNAIIGYSEMLAEDALADGLPHYATDLERVRSAGYQLLELINQVLDLSKVEAGRIELFYEEVRPLALTRSLLDTMRPLLEKNRNLVELVCEPHTPVLIRSDQTRLRQILTNILSNASKFSQDSQITITLGPDHASAAPRLLLRVADRGIGMTPAEIQRVFEPFQQADASTTRRFGGTGLGMAITRHLVQLLGGEVTIESEAGVGTTVTVQVPVVEAVAARVGAESDVVPVATPSGPLVLIVDDESDARGVLRRTLSRGGYRTISASDGAEALDLARAHRPALITLDIMMPVLDGWSTLAALRRDPALARTPVLMCSVLDDQRLSLSLGAQDYLAKPVDRDALLEAVARHVPDRRSSVLVVDDDSDARELLGRRLEGAGYRVHYASDGQEALDALEQHQPGLLMLDLMMPRVDGFEVLRALRAREDALSRIPVVVVTAKELEPADHAAFSEQVQTVLEKGVYSTERLLVEVERALSARVAG